MIEVKALHKQYGELTAVAGVSFTAEPGQVFGLLGPNGAGKSTVIGCISGLLAPTSGRVRVLGHDVVNDGVRARRELGVVPQELALYEDLSAAENLHYWGAAYGLRREALKGAVAETLSTIGLLDRAGDPVKTYSGGMKRRLNFGCGVVHSPKVLLLDEPTVGVDPQSRERLLAMVRAQADSGRCVLYTTHYMEEAQSLCDALAIIDGGRIVAQGTLAGLREQMGERDVLRLTGHFSPDAVRSAFSGEEGIEVLLAESDHLHLAVRDASKRLPRLFETLSAAGAEVHETTLAQPNLESLFIKLTGKALRE